MDSRAVDTQLVSKPHSQHSHESSIFHSAETSLWTPTATGVVIGAAPVHNNSCVAHPLPIALDHSPDIFGCTVVDDDWAASLALAAIAGTCGVEHGNMLRQQFTTPAIKIIISLCFPWLLALLFNQKHQ